MKAAPGVKLAPAKDESREARIERVRLAIAEGSYQVDGLAVSQAIVRKSILRTSIVRKSILPTAGNQ